MMRGVAMAPIEVPLWRTPLPSERSRASSRSRVALIPHGQCPPSKNPSSVRQASNWSGDSQNPVAQPTPDQRATTTGYSQRRGTRSARTPNPSEPAANAMPNHISRVPYCSLLRSNSRVMRTAAFASVWRSM
jgi:hypothetical protein